MTDIIDNINKLITSNYIYRFRKELDHIQELESSNSSDQDKQELLLRKELLNQLISQYYAQPKQVTNKETLFDTIDKQIYSQPWKRLLEPYKDNRVKLFIEENHKDHPDKDQLFDVIKSKYKSLKTVIYDTKDAKIISINGLKYTNGQFSIS